MSAAEGLRTRLPEKKVGERPGDRGTGAIGQWEGDGDNAIWCRPGPEHEATRLLRLLGQFPCQHGEPDPAMPGQAAEKAWARGEETQVFALNVCPASLPAYLPAHPIALIWLIGSESSPSRGVRNKSCLQEALGQTGRETGPGTGEWLLDPRKVRTKSGRRLGWEAGMG